MRTPLRVLNVAEKPSVAKELSRLLSSGRARFANSCSRYNGLYTFDYILDGKQCSMTFTSVAGHLMELDFHASFKKWSSCQPSDLFHAPTLKKVPQDKIKMRQNLEAQARHSQWLILWLDCDREGENIAFEVMEVCLKMNPRLRVKRARFSAIILRDVQAALNHLVEPDEKLSAAVETRQEIDLRVGAAFTRFQTLLLQDKLPSRQHPRQDARSKLISYGPCQFPTLGFIVQRTWQIAAHQAEPCWSIEVDLSIEENSNCRFTWERGQLYDKETVDVLFGNCTNEPRAIVLQVEGSKRSRYPPLPLSTLEMQKKAVSHLRMSSERVMKLAEELYQAGFISYPRTETDEFETGYDLQAMIGEQAQDQQWGSYAARLLDGSLWKPPSSGGHNDHAHPPIHPMKHGPGEAQWSSEKKALYALIVRAFLATCSRPAIGFETKVVIEVAGEMFHTLGLIIHERNWLDVYPYTAWVSSPLPVLQPGQELTVANLHIRQAMSRPPSALSEKQLITLMEQHGIGTDATVAEHIHKQLERGYATKEQQDMTFSPTALGESLVSAYQKIGLQELWLPELRRTFEEGVEKVAVGQDSKQHVVQAAVMHFRRNLQTAVARQGRLQAEIAQFFPRAE